MKVLKPFLAAIILLLASTHLLASPLAIVEGAADNVVSALKKNKVSLKSNPALVHRIVRRYIIPHVDTLGMARSVLGRKVWGQASSLERKKFEQQFINLVIRTYSKALANYDGEKITFYPPRRGANSSRFVKVYSVIKPRNGKNVSLAYSVVRKKGGWKVFDLTVEGVSLLQSFRSQFQRELNNHSLMQLIHKLKRKSKKG